MNETVKTILIIVAVLVILYLWMIRPRLSRRSEWKKFDSFLIAHRGLHDNNTAAPENSMAAFRKAIVNGYGIEMDVQITKDHIPVIFHDDTLERMTGQSGACKDYTLEELKQFRLGKSDETIPTFQEFLEMVDGRVPLIIEIKASTMDITVCPYAYKVLENYKGVYCIESFNPIALSWFRRYHNEILRGQLSTNFMKTGDGKGFQFFCLKNLLMNFMSRPDFIAYDHRYHKCLSRVICCKLFGAKSVAWTIKSQERIDTFRKKNTFQIFIFEGFMPRKK